MFQDLLSLDLRKYVHKLLNKIDFILLIIYRLKTLIYSKIFTNLMAHFYIIRRILRNKKLVESSNSSKNSIYIFQYK